MQVVDELVGEKIVVTPNELPERENIKFLVTSICGVSFPKDDRTPTIIVQLREPVKVQSVTIPRDKTPYANVQQFEVTFYSPVGSKINARPILTHACLEGDQNNPPGLHSTQIPSNIPVARLEIRILHTTDGESPKGVILDIKACAEAPKTCEVPENRTISFKR